MVRVTTRLESGLFNQAAFRRSLIKEVTHWSAALEVEMKTSIQKGPKTGRIYPRAAIRKVIGAKTAASLGLRKGGLTSKGKQRFIVGFGFHQASAPGQSPASDSSNLVLSIVHTRAVSDARGVHAEVTVNARYGAILEHGGGRIAPRPYRAPAMRKIEPKFQRGIDGLVAKAAA